MTKAKKYLQDSYKGTPNAILPAGYVLYQIALSEKDKKKLEFFQDHRVGNYQKK